MASLLLFLLELNAAYFLLSVVVRYWRLRHIPGPLWASLTDLWRARKQWSGMPVKSWVLDLHQRYGPIVRTAPNTVIVSDAASMRTIFSSKGEFVKAPSYSAMRAFVDGRSVGSIIDIQDEERFKAVKRAVGASFITKNLLDFEPDVDDTLVLLKQRLINHPTGPLFRTLQLFQLDFLLKATFSETPSCLEEGRDVFDFASSNLERGRHWIRWQPMPQLEHLLFQNRIWGRFLKRDVRWLHLGRKLVGKRTAETCVERKHDLLQRFLDTSEKHPDVIHPDTVVSVVYSTISAGTDTTVSASSSMIFYLLKNPETYLCLMGELNEAVASGKLSDPPKYVETNSLPYLDAVMKEALRLNPSPPILLERVVPKEGTILVGKPIPAGTIVACLASVVHLDKKCFGEDANEFRPERWLTSNEEERLRMERGWIAFGGGSRVCLGRHIAELEIKKAVPMLLLNFNIRFADGPEPATPFGASYTFTRR